MTNDPLYQDLLEKSWRRKLTQPEEAALQALLAADPERRRAWEAEAGLNEVLERLPNVPVASNFTARVIQGLETEQRTSRSSRAGFAWRWWTVWLPRGAFAAVVVLVALSSYHIGAVARERQLAAGVEAVAGVPSLPSPEVLKDFDAIRALPASPQADSKLLALME